MPTADLAPFAHAVGGLLIIHEIVRALDDPDLPGGQSVKAFTGPADHDRPPTDAAKAVEEYWDGMKARR